MYPSSTNKTSIIFCKGYFLTVFDKNINNGELRFINNVVVQEKISLNVLFRLSHLHYQIFDYLNDIKDAFPKTIDDGTYFWASRDDIYRIKNVYGFQFSPDVIKGIDDCWNVFFENIYDQNPTYNTITFYSPTHMLRQELNLGVCTKNRMAPKTHGVFNDFYMFFDYNDALLLLKQYIKNNIIDYDKEVDIEVAASRDYGIIRISLVPPQQLQLIDLIKHNNDEYNRIVYNALNRDRMVMSSTIQDDKDYNVLINISSTSFIVMDGINEYYFDDERL